MSYTFKLFSTGAVRKTPKKVIYTMLASVAGSYEIIVEIGAGKGELTNVLQGHLQFNQYYAFEIDEKACEKLKKEFPSIVVQKADAFHFYNYLPESKKIDLFLSSIPLSFYSAKKVRELLNVAKGLLNNDGKIVIIFTAFWLTWFFKKILPGSRITSFLTFPPYFILVYQKKQL